MERPLGTSKDEFLAAVRQALGRSATSEGQRHYSRLNASLADLAAQADQVQRRSSDQREALTARFLETAGLRGWKVHWTANREDALGYIVKVATQHGVDEVVRSEQEIFQELPVDSALTASGVGVTTVARDEQHSRESLRQQIIAAGIGITGADYAVAETGSVVVLPRRGLSRLVSLVPPVHIAIVRPQEIVDTLDDIFLLRRLEYYRNSGDMGSYLNFITGPSRTADIEQTLVVGVHGPREVHLVLLG